MGDGAQNGSSIFDIGIHTEVSQNGKKPASKEDKNPALEKEKNSTSKGGGIGMNLKGK
jgi:hypothetical protein